MSTYEPGTVAVATVRGEPNVRIAYVDSEDTVAPWIALTGRAPGDWLFTDDVTAVRPLIVLDLKGVDGRDLAHVLREEYDDWEVIADQIEAQTRPAIPEPTGLGAVVKDRDGRTWVRTDDREFPWRCGSVASNWAGVRRSPVEVLSEGVTA